MDDYQAFSDSFPFEETPDQAQAIAAVMHDMGSPSAMDRLVCGDVGFGKTEVAMRAAFLAANAGKQVAILVPTTLLAQQHYENFKDRFAAWPFEIEVMSRFVSGKAQKSVIERIGEGKVDIVVVTHKLLSSDIKYKDLGRGCVRMPKARSLSSMTMAKSSASMPLCSPPSTLNPSVRKICRKR